MLSDVFFDDLGIPAPDVHLGVGSGSHGVQTGSMLGALDAVFDEHAPDWVLVYGDTNSTLAAALSAVKLHSRGAPRGGPALVQPAHARRAQPGAHRPRRRPAASHRPRSPWATSRTRASPSARCMVGDVMTDVLFQVRDAVAGAPSALVEELGLAAGELPCRDHPPRREHRRPRPARRDRRGLSSLDHPVILLAHPRVVAKAAAHGIELTQGSLIAHAPLAYPDLIAAVLASAGRRHRLRRPAEGGVPAARARARRCAPRPSGSRRSSSAGTCSRTPPTRSPPRSAAPPRSRPMPRPTATDVRRIGSSPSSCAARTDSSGSARQERTNEVGGARARDACVVLALPQRAWRVGSVRRVEHGTDDPCDRFGRGIRFDDFTGARAPTKRSQEFRRPRLRRSGCRGRSPP